MKYLSLLFMLLPIEIAHADLDHTTCDSPRMANGRVSVVTESIDHYIVYVADRYQTGSAVCVANDDSSTIYKCIGYWTPVRVNGQRSRLQTLRARLQRKDNMLNSVTLKAYYTKEPVTYNCLHSNGDM